MKKLLLLLLVIPNLVMAESKTLKLEPFWDEEYYSEWRQRIKNNNTDCKNAMSTLDMIACGYVEEENIYKTYYEYYKKAISVVTPDAAKSLFKAYDNGTNYRGAFCTAAYENTTGTRRGTLVQHCTLVLTQANTHFLWDQFLTNRAGEAEFSDFPEPIPTHKGLYK